MGEPSCPGRDTRDLSTSSTLRTPTVTPSPPGSTTCSSSARATSPTSPFPRARESSSPSPRRETRDLADKPDLFWDEFDDLKLFMSINCPQVNKKKKKKKKKKVPSVDPTA